MSQFDSNSIQRRKTESTGFLLVLVVASVLCVAFSISCFTTGKVIAAIEIDDKINPNTAPVASLIRLSGIGKSRAYEIIDYRQSIEDKTVFKTASDMCNIKGIGTVTADKIGPHLRFDDRLPDQYNKD